MTSTIYQNRGKPSQRHRGRWHGACGVLAAVGAIGFADLAKAQNWLQPAGGSWDNTVNWSGGTLPGNAVFNLATNTPYVVTLGGLENATSVNVSGNSVTIDCATGKKLQLSGSLNLTPFSGQTTSLTINGTSPLGSDGSGLFVFGGSIQEFPGSVTAGSFITNNAQITIEAEPYNFSAGTTAVFNDSAVTASMYFSGNATFNGSTGSATFGNFGTNMAVYGTAAVLNIVNGSNLSMPDTFAIGSTNVFGPAPTGKGTVNLNASQLTATQFVDVGATGGTGSLNLSNGAVATGQVISIGAAVLGTIASPGIGSMTIAGSGSNASASQLFIVGPTSSLQLSGGGMVNAAQFNLSQGSLLGMTLDGDRVNVTGAALLVGTLDVSLDTHPDPTAGESFDLFTFGSESGTFSTINLPPLDPGLSWNAQQLYTNGTISVVGVPEPTTAALAAAGIALLPRRRRRR